MVLIKYAELNLNLNAKDNNGKTGFHKACETNDSEIVEMLVRKSIKFNIDLNAKDKDGRTGLHYACFGGHKTGAQIYMMYRHYTKSYVEKNQMI